MDKQRKWMKQCHHFETKNSEPIHGTELIRSTFNAVIPNNGVRKRRENACLKKWVICWLVVSTHLKNMIVKMGIFPKGVKITNIWNHHLVCLYRCIQLVYTRRKKKHLIKIYLYFLCPVRNRWVCRFFLDCLAHFHSSKPSTCSILWKKPPLRSPKNAQGRLYSLAAATVIYVK